MIESKDLTEAVIKLMARDYEGAVDYESVDDEMVIIYDEHDEILAIIENDKLIDYYNEVEGEEG